MILGTIAAILYANGYRFEIGGNGTGNFKFIEGTGLLVATSRPDGARVIVNDHLTTATNNTINLAPGVYEVKIEKDGYVGWKKKIIIKIGFVSEANALLIPTAPKLEAVTTIGISNLIMDATQTVLAYNVASNSATKNGIYSLDMSARPLIFLADTGTQLVNDITVLFSQTKLTFSPNGKQLLATFSNGTNYLLDSRVANQTPQDVTNTMLSVERDWAAQKVTLNKKFFDSLPRKLAQQAVKYFKDPVPAPVGDRILYTASTSGTLNSVVEPQAPSVNSTPEQRNLKSGITYVYDLKEDRNYEIGSGDIRYYWHADGRHLVFAENGHVNVVEFDGGNLTTVYEGNFLNNQVFPWPDGTSIGIISRFSAGVPYNLYRIGLQ